MLAYRLLTEDDTSAFCHKVTAALAAGWSLQGPPVYAFDAARGKPVWKSYAGGPIYYPPSISHDRLFVGSADGKVYAFSIRKRIQDLR